MKRFDEKEIEILMLDGCTKAEAEKHLKKGTVIYSDLEERFAEYMQEWNIDEEEQEAYKEMVNGGAPVLDWGVVKKDGKTYYIQYCL